MSVKIVGMEMPKKCAECRFFVPSQGWWGCYAYSDDQFKPIEDSNIKPSWCPLQEVKE